DFGSAARRRNEPIARLSGPRPQIFTRCRDNALADGMQFAADARAGAGMMAAAAELLGQREHVDAALAAEIDANQARLALGKEDRDFDAVQRARDFYLFVDRGRVATGALNFIVRHRAPGEPAVPRGMRV